MPTLTTVVRAQSALLHPSRLPLFSRLVIALVAVSSILLLQSTWDIRQWGFLVPSRVGIVSAYRANTYPFVHTSIVHAAFNAVVLAPLVSRFEMEYGTLTSLALFFGPFSTFPALIYVLIDRLFLHTDVAVGGASTWIFLLLGLESAKSRKTRSSMVVGSLRIPTWTALLATVTVKEVFLPSSALMGPICGAVVGYGCGLGLLSWLVPPGKLLSWLEAKLVFLKRLPNYVTFDQRAQGRDGILPTSASFSMQPGAISEPL